MALYINGKQISGGGGGGNTNSVELTYAEYQALTPEQQLDGTEYFITDINGDGQQFQPIIYSEEEREIGVWTDGRPVYQKTVTGTFSNATYLNISVADLDVLAILEIEGILLASDSANIVNIGSDDAGAVRFSHTAITPGSALEYITISKNNASSYGTASQVYATLRYIKSTDTAGSGTWTPQGVPAHHYSTDEQVVGTWIDGSTLYEKTLAYNITTSLSDWTLFDDTVSYDVLVSAQGTVSLGPTEQQVISSSPAADPRFEVKSDHKLYYFGSATRSGYMTFTYTKSLT